MRILIWGLGHTGTVAAVGFAAMGHDVVGIDPDVRVVDAFRAGRPLAREPGVDSLLMDLLASGRLRASASGRDLLAGADAAVVCVGTAGADGRTSSVDRLLEAARELGAGLGNAPRGCRVVLRSTVEVGFTRGLLIPALERHSGRCAGRDFSVAYVPEFLREGSALEDFRSPSFVVLGLVDAAEAPAFRLLFESFAAPCHVVAPEEAELFKLVNNAFHALKIGFANEVGRLADALSVDPRRIMELVAADQRPGAPAAYLRPGFAFGGSCLPKDLCGLLSTAESRKARLPILASVLPSNELHLEAACRKIRGLGVRRVGIAGLAFKPGTGDMRGSAAILLAARLREQGLEVLLFDPEVDFALLPDSGRAFCLRHLPDLGEIIRRDAGQFVDESDAIVITAAHASLEELRSRCLAGGRALLVLDVAEETLPPRE